MLRVQSLRFLGVTTSAEKVIAKEAVKELVAEKRIVIKKAVFCLFF
jgi:hypothetical protein